jgi:hypothetical protein
MAIRTELTLRLPNSPGALAGVCHVLAEQGVDIHALSLDAHGHCHLIVNHTVRATSALRALHHTVAERDVIFASLGAGPGSAAAVLSLLSGAGININYAYSAMSDSRGPAALVVGVDDAQRAAAASGV